MTHTPADSHPINIEPKPQLTDAQLIELAQQIKRWGQELGFANIGITDIDLSAHEPKLQSWLDNQYHGEMAYMANHGMMRARPAELHPGTIRVISARMDYLPPNAGFAVNLADPNLGYISRYAGGRDYHKLMRQRLKKLGERISSHCEQLHSSHHNFRPFVDSAPILERQLGDNAGLGWTGKHSLLIDPQAGSWFFLGELLVDIALPTDKAITPQCNQCVACIKSCPTNAIVEDGVVDGRRCISYLTIELQDAIPLEFREAIGNRIYGCDDCQLVCPFNGQTPLTQENDFHTREKLIQPDLLNLFSWDETTFLSLTQGSAIRRIGHRRWLRNIAVALGNAPFNDAIVSALEHKKNSQEVDEMVIEHIDWALTKQRQQQASINRKTQRVIRTVQRGMPRDA
ncbi:tRNA epoxyqueuosine(34) reductase QueG [Shewanella intestini]|uniref:Epoxyqueuosine reductase n=1 Tax=Shewanella intestini TaxID=2017544 RepID=A0ABS5I564_9GAMM|nr:MULTISPECIES: tRNA epoxyqueuosine(34) reductase QueG [Shewanella]MBR9728515.1 tRNA epoxyqueuosine(34) reductase QueG [Shewanella intestini]MRG36334.1 tRNA epoxyqueuosine(34) reductase QueG [Shewanella sp. XMDDZSB0408]